MLSPFMFLAGFESQFAYFYGLVKCYPDAFGVFMLRVAEHLFFFFLGGISDCFVLENVGARGLFYLIPHLSITLKHPWLPIFTNLKELHGEKVPFGTFRDLDVENGVPQFSYSPCS